MLRFDPSQFIVEHYVDGDLVDETYPIHRSLASPDNLHVWGEYFLSFDGNLLAEYSM